MSEKAIDVFEKYQGLISWTAVFDSGVHMAFVKLANGAGVASPPGDHYISGGHAAGVRMGGYAYALAGDPVAQANVFADELLRLGALDLAPGLDYEDSSLPTGPAAQGWIIPFLTQLSARIPALDRVLLYSSGSKLQAMRAWEITVPGAQVLEWDAEYWTNDGTEHPIRYYSGHEAVHQFTSAGTTPGVRTLVDEDSVSEDISAIIPAALSATSTEDEEMTITAPAGTNEHVDLIVKGKTKLLLSCSWGQSVSLGGVLFYGDPNPDGSVNGVGGGYAGFTRAQTQTVVQNKATEFDIPAGAASATVLYTAAHSFAIGAV